MFTFTSSFKRIRPTIRFTVVAIFFLATCLTAIVALGLQYYHSKVMATESALLHFNSISESTSDYLTSVDDRFVQTASVLASYPGLVEGNTASPSARSIFAELMQSNPMMYAIYLGFENGDFYQLINLSASFSVRRQLNALPEERWLLVNVSGEGGARQRTYQYYTADFDLHRTETVASNYFAFNRPWFTKANHNEVYKTTPYLFSNLQAPGQTYSKQLKGTTAVVAVDIALSSLSDYLSYQRVSSTGEVYLYQKSGDIIASNVRNDDEVDIPLAAPITLNNEEREVLAAHELLRISNEADWAPIDFSVAGNPKGYSVDYLKLVGEMLGVPLVFINGYSWPDLITLFHQGDIDLLQPVFQDKHNAIEGEYSDPILSLSYSLVTLDHHDAITDLSAMNGKTLAIPEGWTIHSFVREYFPEIRVQTVAGTYEMLAAVATGKADAGLDIGEILHYVGNKYFFRGLMFHDFIQFEVENVPTELRIVVSEENQSLLPIINKAIAAISEEQKQALAEKWFAQGSQSHEQAIVPYEPLVELAGVPDKYTQLHEYDFDGKGSYVYVSPVGRGAQASEFLAIVIPKDIVLQSVFEKVKWSIFVSVAFLLLLLPAPWLFASPIVGPIKKLAAENEKIRLREYDKLDIPSSHIHEIHELGRSMKVMASAIREHEIQQRGLMDSFIKIIAQAIDDKSSHTAGHCERVPELAMLLTEKAELSTSSAFADFHFNSEDERREFRIGAWLHDCGKITTPEHIVDKGSKLEVIYNRIHEIRTRFEVLWRDAEVHYWRQVAQGGKPETLLQAELVDRQDQLQDDFAFVATMNLGSEFLDDKNKLRLMSIAEQTWQRHFSDRLGLSPPEEARLSGAESELPCREPLLVDRPEHVLRRDQAVVYPEEFGIKMTVPENVYNQGELYNLMVERGTLTPEDRFKINEHIISTIRMLDTLPLPAELGRVPRYASTHHEKLNGQGYPRRLQGHELSVPERIMVLADIFEALTAADRPYKKAKPLSVAIDILHSMVLDKHVDRDVFELFLSSGVYREYAKRFLLAEQIDTVDVDRYLSGQSDQAHS